MHGWDAITTTAQQALPQNLCFTAKGVTADDATVAAVLNGTFNIALMQIQADAR